MGWKLHKIQYIPQWATHGLLETQYVCCCSVKYIGWNCLSPRSSKKSRGRERIIPQQPIFGSHEPWEVISCAKSVFFTQHSLAEILGVCLAEWSQYCNMNVKIVLSIDSLANEEKLWAFYDFTGWPYVLRPVYADEIMVTELSQHCSC